MPLVKMELLASLVALDPPALSDLLAQLDLLADLVQTDSLEALVLKAKLELLVSPEALVKMAVPVHQALNLAQLALKDPPDPLALTVLLAKMVSPVDQVPQAKMDFQADLVSQVDPDNQANLERTVSTELQEHLASLVDQDLQDPKVNQVLLASLAAPVAQDQLDLKEDPDHKVNQVHQASPADLALLDLREDPDPKEDLDLRDHLAHPVVQDLLAQLALPEQLVP